MIKNAQRGRPRPSDGKSGAATLGQLRTFCLFCRTVPNWVHCATTNNFPMVVPIFIPRVKTTKTVAGNKISRKVTERAPSEKLFSHFSWPDKESRLASRESANPKLDQAKRQPTLGKPDRGREGGEVEGAVRPLRSQARKLCASPNS